MSLDSSLAATTYRPTKSSSKVHDLSLSLQETSHAGATKEETLPGSSNHNAPRSDQHLLWIDGVGGFRLCLAEELTLGHPGGDRPSGTMPDIGLLADLSRQHIKLRRSVGDWMLMPLAPVWMDGRLMEGPALLTDGAELRLGETARLRFRQPHALSATATLTVESGHRTHPAADGIVLMAESCVLGPKPHSHIRCRDWATDLLLFRTTEGLLCRSEAGLLVDGVPTKEPIKILPGLPIEGQDFTICIEEAV